MHATILYLLGLNHVRLTFRHNGRNERLTENSGDVIASTLHTMSAKNALHTDEVFVGLAFRQNKLDRLQGFLGGGSKP